MYFPIPLALIQIADVLVPLAGIAVGGLILLIPIVGLTARFAIKPLLDAWTQTRAFPADDDRVLRLEQRVAQLEQQVELVELQNDKLIEEAEFRLKLDAGR